MGFNMVLLYTLIAVCVLAVPLAICDRLNLDEGSILIVYAVLGIITLGAQIQI